VVVAVVVAADTTSSTVQRGAPGRGTPLPFPSSANR